MLDKRQRVPHTEGMTSAPRTARHFAIGTRVSHRDLGEGVICADENGVKYPQFERWIGTRYTRVVEIPESDPRANH